MGVIFILWIFQIFMFREYMFLDIFGFLLDISGYEILYGHTMSNISELFENLTTNYLIKLDDLCFFALLNYLII